MTPHSDQIVDASWLNRPSTDVAADLIGCSLVRQFEDGTQLRGLIVEAEAYGPEDPACHAYRRRTPRNEVMFGFPGNAYVYLIYGMYHCLNVVTDDEGVPSAVLLRALALDTIPDWIDDRKRQKPARIAAGPGKLCQALQIDRSLNGIPLSPEQPLWLEHRSLQFQQALQQKHSYLVQTTRIGLSQAADFPWRWYLKDCAAVSKP